MVPGDGPPLGEPIPVTELRVHDYAKVVEQLREIEVERSDTTSWRFRGRIELVIELPVLGLDAPPVPELPRQQLSVRCRRAGVGDERDSSAPLLVLFVPAKLISHSPFAVHDFTLGKYSPLEEKPGWLRIRLPALTLPPCSPFRHNSRILAGRVLNR